MTNSTQGWNSDAQPSSESSRFSSHFSTRPLRSRSQFSSTPKKHFSGTVVDRIRAGLRSFSWTKWLLGSLGFLALVYGGWVYFVVVNELPVITNESLESGNFSQSSSVMDRNGEVLYKFYEENREFIKFENIAPQAINAFVAMEDQSFWENGGVDVSGLLRNIYQTVKKVLGFKARIGGASTITQQLLKNILALDKNESGFYDKIIRKHKERLLVSKLADVIKTAMRQQYPNASSDEIDRKQKERVMELYINFIYLGHQSYGIQAASQSYFAKNASELNIVESAILASMPQSPSYYDLYKNPTRVLGNFVIKATDGTQITQGPVYDAIVHKIATMVFEPNRTIAKGNNNFQNFTTSVVPANLTIDNAIYSITYTPGRKDAVLNRMYEDGYITQDELKQSFIDGLNLKLSSGKVTIKTPHFVFWIKDLLLSDPEFAQLGITEELLNQGGIQVKTTLDINIQNIAEKAVKDNMSALYDRGGNNRSMLHIDTNSGDVLAYVGSADYNNVQIGGQNDMVRSKRQPGSSIKPLVYAYFLQHVPSTLDTPIYDIQFTVGGLSPKNADGKFNGLMPLKQALAHSRNIPTVKVFLGGGQEEKIKPYLRSLGLQSLRPAHEYGYSLSLGAGEVPMLEMAQAYSALSQLGESAKINPILEIRDKNGNILYQKQVQKQPTAIDPVVAGLIWEILSNSANMPSNWVSSYAVRGLKYAVKSGTSNKIITENGKEISVPRDGWLATYTPNSVTMYWAGNADDSPMNKNTYGLMINSEVNRSFYTAMLAQGYLKNDPMPVVPGKQVTISKITGRIATADTPVEYQVQTVGFNVDIPADRPYNTISVDSLCGGKISPLTPSEQRQRVVLFEPVSITSLDTQDIVKRYAEQNLLLSDPNNFYARFFTKEPVDYCEGRQIQQSDSIQVSTSLVAGQSVALRTSVPFSASTSQGLIKKVMILANDMFVGSYAYDQAQVSDTKQINLSALEHSKDIKLQIIAVDDQNRSNSITINTILTKVDEDKPSLDTKSVKVIPTGDGFDASMIFSDATSGIEEVVITLPTGQTKKFTTANVGFAVPTLGIIQYKVRDVWGNALEGQLDLAPYLP